MSTSTWENKTSIPWTSTWEGKEVRDLVAPRKQRPDGVRRGADGEVADVFFYHGDLYHGYPPEHELYDTEVTLPEGQPGTAVGPLAQVDVQRLAVDVQPVAAGAARQRQTVLAVAEFESVLHGCSFRDSWRRSG